MRSLVGLLVSAVVVACASPVPRPVTDGPAPEAQQPGLEGCAGPAIVVDGRRPLALLVGAGRFANRSIGDLKGPRSDVDAMRALLAAYGFPGGNVCALVDEKATVDAFRQAFERALVERAQPGDVAVLFFSGQTSWRVGAEDAKQGGSPSAGEATFVLHDSRAGRPDLGKSELDAMLLRLYARTRNVVVILDATARRGAARRSPAEGARGTAPLAAGQGPAAAGDTGERERWLPGGMDDAVLLAAADEGSQAYEVDGHGVFSSALVDVAGRPTRSPLTYAQALPQIASRMAASSPQAPLFEGALDRALLGASAAARPVVWRVISVAPTLEIEGPPLVGMGTGAELRVYDGSLAPEAYSDPRQAKATIVVSRTNGSRSVARVDAAAPDVAIQKGDLAVLVGPSDVAILLRVRVRPESESGGIPKTRASRLKAALDEDPDARSAVTVVTRGAFELELSVAPDGQLQLRDSDGRLRSTYVRDDVVPRSLWQHVRQKALLLLRGEGGSDFTDNETLEVSLRPSPEQRDCGRARAADWVAAPPNTEQVVPLCLAYRVHVRHSSGSSRPLRVGGVFLSSDGSTLGFPRAGNGLVLEPGAELDFPETFLATPPVDLLDTVRVFGTDVAEPVDWEGLTWATPHRGVRSTPSALQSALERRITPGSRRSGAAPAGEASTWTVSTLRVRVVANPEFEAPRRGGGSREVPTPRPFDIRPYLPDAQAAALRQLLLVADRLARMGVPYGQHDWSAATEGENLARGLDASRAVWYAFTRSGLPYVGGRDRYVTTAEMVSEPSPMAEQFERCDPDSLRTGDLLVYRDEGRGDGHVFMVVDPARRIGWGSVSWPGGVITSSDAGRGAAFQRVLSRQDWARWDRASMSLRACWRHRRLAAEALSGIGVAGLGAYGGDACDPARCFEPPPVVR